MTNIPVSPTGIAATAANYAHAVLSEAPQRLLHTSGVLPVRPDGTTPTLIADQAACIWDNIGAILDGAEMTPTDIVSVITYAVVGQDLGPVMAERDKALAGHLAASTLVTVSALARPEWLMEIAVVAAS